MSEIPKHLGLIPDGNRRWAERENLSTTEGHQRGFETFKDFCKWSKEAGVGILTAYGFSTENWNRPQQEVEYLMELFRKEMQEAKQRMIEGEQEELEKARIRVVGDREKLSDELQQTIAEVEDFTSDNGPLQLNLAINYGGRWDIKQAVSKAVKETKEQAERRIGDLKDRLQVKSSPDLIIRTGGEKRLSNFLVWQAAYSELFFSDKLWPDFSEEDFEKALKDYAERKRRFGE